MGSRESHHRHQRGCASDEKVTKILFETFGQPGKKGYRVATILIVGRGYAC